MFPEAYPCKPAFYYMSTGLMGSELHRDVSLIRYALDEDIEVYSYFMGIQIVLVDIWKV